MSHTVTVKELRLTDKDALDKALERLGNKVEVLGHGTHQLYAGPQTGLGLRLRGGVAGNGEEGTAWQFPIVIQEDGSVAYDNYGEHWGKQVFLDELVQGYTLAKLEIEATAKGHTFSQNVAENGDVELHIHAGTAAGGDWATGGDWAS